MKVDSKPGESIKDSERRIPSRMYLVRPSIPKCDDEIRIRNIVQESQSPANPKPAKDGQLPLPQT